MDTTEELASGPITSWETNGETVETVSDFIFGGSRITADGDCSHEIKRRQTPLSPRPAPQPRRPQPRRRPRGAFPGGHGGAPGLPTLGLGPFAPSAAPRRLPAPTGAQRLRAPRTRIPAGGSGQGVCGVAEGGGVGAPKLLGPAGEGAGDRFLCSLGVGAGPGLWGTRGSRSVVTRSWRYPWDGRREPDP